MRWFQFGKLLRAVGPRCASKVGKLPLQVAGGLLCGGAAIYAGLPTVQAQALNSVEHAAEDEELRQIARKLFKAACVAVDPKVAVVNGLSVKGDCLTINNERINMKDYDEVIVLGAGKACIGMAEGVKEVLGERITKGVIITKYEHAKDHKLSGKFQVYEANHPTPDEAGVVATTAMLEMARSAGPRSLVLCLISGGSSALLVAPAEGIPLGDLMESTKQLLGCGCPIEEKNAVLKHLSCVKGGRLVQACFPARVVSMVLSDVVGDPLDAIGSGPTVPDHSTYVDCLQTLGKYKIFDSFPRTCHDRLVRGAAGLNAESPKEGDVVFQHASTVVVAGNKTAVDAAVAEAKALGFNTLALSSFMEGEAKEVAKFFVALAKEEVRFQSPVPLPACIVMGGETTVTLPEQPGVGGRNQLMALSAAQLIKGMSGVAILAGGTDGGDGPKNDSAGAVVVGGDASDAEKVGLDLHASLEGCDSYTFFKKLEEAKFGRHNVLHLRDGPTGTNVADVTILLVR